ncbi:MAG: histidine kinase, gyrase and HSP90-like ATPase family protein [Acidobacteria bacterium]|nr:histidine kinase, gyrase and HSP90-like ATPase family protein [Acidobacteriota bacterium]
MMVPRRRRLSRTIAIAVVVDLIAVIAAAAVIAQYTRQPFVIAGATAAAAIPLTYLLLRGPLRRMRANLSALTDGVRGFADGDFSLRLRVTGDDEITDLIAFYNEIGAILRTQRNESMQRELLFETVLQTTPLSVILTTDGDRVVYANRAARDLFAPDRLEGRRLNEVLAPAPALREAFTSERDALFAAGSETYHLSRRTFFLNGREHLLWIANRLTPELRRQEIEVWKRAIRVLNHELNNSLAPIRSLFHSARVIRDRPEQLHRLDEINDAVEERLDYLQRFLDGYSQFARLPKPRREEVAWSALLDSVQRIMPFRIVEPRPSHSSKVDPAQIEQVLINLLKNASDAGSPIGETEVAVERRAGGSLLVVSDRGEGMSEETMIRALLPFWSTRAGGSGLGLPLCAEIIDGHGGHLRIAHRDGGGSVVSCWIPDEA